MTKQRRSLALPHRAFRYSRVNWSHAVVGLIALVVMAAAGFLYRIEIWNWQTGIWLRAVGRLGISAHIAGIDFHWLQPFFMTDLRDVLLTSSALLLITYLVFRSTVGPTLKGLFIMGTVPLFLYCLVVYLRGLPPDGALNHIGAEWLYGEIYLWCLIPLLYAVFIFPVPLSLPIKLLSLAVVMGMSIIWRTATPVAYVAIAYYSRGVLAIPAWMALGPWADFLYVVPMFAVTLSFYRGGIADDYRA